MTSNDFGTDGGDDTDEEDQCNGCWRYSGPNNYCVHCGLQEMRQQDDPAVATPDPEGTWFADQFRLDTEGAECHKSDTRVGRVVEHDDREYEASFTVCIEDEEAAERLREMFGGENSGGDSVSK